MALDFDGKILVRNSSGLEGERVYARNEGGGIIIVGAADFQGASAMVLVPDTPENREQSGGFYLYLPPRSGQGAWWWAWCPTRKNVEKMMRKLEDDSPIFDEE